MPVTFTKRRGKVVGMSMTFAEMRVTYKKLTGKVIPRDVDDGKCTSSEKFNECGAELMANFTEAQIREAVESFNHEDWMTGDY